MHSQFLSNPAMRFPGTLPETQVLNSRKFSLDRVCRGKVRGHQNHWKPSSRNQEYVDIVEIETVRQTNYLHWCLVMERE